MPLMETIDSAIDPDVTLRPILVAGIDLITPEWEKPFHHHRKSQLIFTARGVVTCETRDGIWIVPPQCGIWIPGGMPHGVRGSGDLESYYLFVDRECVPSLPEKCCTVALSDLLQQLLRRAAKFPESYDIDGPPGRLVSIILDELAVAPVERFFLPMPADHRIRNIARHLIDNPSDPSTLSNWASRVGMGERTLSRRIRQETGMTFGRWRRHLHILVGLRQLSDGKSVHTVSLALGYESASAFITMFKKILGKPPARYLAECPLAVSARPANALSDQRPVSSLAEGNCRAASMVRSTTTSAD